MGKSNVETSHQKNLLDNTKKLRNLLSEMPGFCKDYFRGIENTTSIRTRVGYAYDLRTFFRFLISENPTIGNDIKDITLKHLDEVKPVDIEEYMDYLKLYYIDDKKFTNDERGLHRKLSSLRKFYMYYLMR